MFYWGSTMKHRVCITIDQETILRIYDTMKSKKFKNKSHFFEVAVSKLLEVEDDSN